MSRCKTCNNGFKLACGGYGCNVSRFKNPYVITWIHSRLCRKYQNEESTANHNLFEGIPIIANNHPIGFVKKINDRAIECILWVQSVDKSYSDIGKTISEIHITCKTCKKKVCEDILKQYM